MRVFTIFFGLIAMVAFTSCSGDDSLNDLKAKTNRLSIVKLDSNGEHISDLEIREKKKIKEIFSFITSNEAPEFKCGEDYEIHCFDKNEKLILLMELNSDDLCKSAVFVYNNKVHHRYLSDEGAEYLKKVLN